MILSPRERSNIENTFEIVCNANLSLEYQLEKIKRISELIEAELDKPRDTWYVNSVDFDYNIDFLINGFSTLIEYYHTWVLQQCIGLIKPECKIKYEAIDKNKIELIQKLMKKYKVGITNCPELYRFNFYEKCKSKYMSAMTPFFIGKNHEIFVLNNYIKHNHMARSYAPLSILDNEHFSFPYLYIDNNRGRLLNRSLFRHLLDLSVDDVINGFDSDFYGSYVSNSEVTTYKMGGLDIVVINGLEYVKGGTSIGISIESMLETIKHACVDILDMMLEEQHCSGITAGTNIDHFTMLKSSFMERKAKTLSNVINKNDS
ncbi:hypothetical protein [Aeromonas veronii]|uniref:hypothetical protein n=1 Tax=Aeromonas veronii TaxID=654 RepID=UPI00226CA1BE|nr:hypothetical protein [Aeromonas veronii]MCX9106186.1 hypothetical protein [Aeromonas veronii]MCX9121983.1 hypothetical protein [Aeromonas veronii]